MRYVLLALVAQIVLCAPVAFANETHPSCEIAKENIIGRTSSGLAQVSNVGALEITCHIPERPFPTKPGESRNGLTARTNTYEFLPDGTKKLVPSEVRNRGNGSTPRSEWANFYLLISLDAKELDAEARRSLAKLLDSMSPDQKAHITSEDQERGLENLKQAVPQNRLGHFKIECQIMDGPRVAGSATVEIEVVFRGRFSDYGLPGVPVA